MVAKKDTTNPQVLPIRLRQTINSKGGSQDNATVLCPTRGQSIPLHDCLCCQQLVDVVSDENCEPVAIRCNPEPRPIERSGERQQESFYGGEIIPEPTAPPAPWREPVSAITALRTICVRSDTTTQDLRALLRVNEVQALPVVNPVGEPIGIVSQTDLLDAETFSTADKLMTPIPICIVESEPISHAAALMTSIGVHQLPVVSKTRQLLGMVSALDIARWVAAKDGLA